MKRPVRAGFFLLLSASATVAIAAQLATELRDFLQPGTQPIQVPPGLSDPIRPSAECMACHAGYDSATEPHFSWVASQKAQTTRNPMFWATLAIANQDADNGGYWCLRCHAPNGWLGGRVTFATDGSGLSAIDGDLDGVNCNFCHRLVDPIFERENPDEDLGVMPGGIYEVKTELHNGIYVVDLYDRRRGPRGDLGDGFPHHAWLESPFHKEALLCASCHDVSSTLFLREPDGTFTFTEISSEHPSHDKRDEFPLERTFSEWAASDFAAGPIEMNGRFGGNQTAVSTCQDCHMPRTSGYAAHPSFGAHFRDDLATHGFNGANTWVMRAIRALHPDSETGLSDAAVDAAALRTRGMHENAADLVAFVRENTLVVRVVNQTGHKLPTGFVEGRRMWINVRFFDDFGGLIGEHGHYDGNTADLTEADTTVYQARHGLDADMANETGTSAGHSFHMVWNNEVLLDNRIPPRGFSNAAFEAFASEPVGASYADQHYWDDAEYALPRGAASAEVRLYYQTTSKEFIEFLRDANTTNSAGQTAYDQWVLHGKSAPVEMAARAIDLSVAECPPPIPIGLAKTLSSGGRPVIEGAGLPKLSTNDFRIRIHSAGPNQFGVLFSSAGTATVPFYGGTRYLKLPMKRMRNFHLDSTGAVEIPITIDGSMVGTERYYQAFFRDPGAAEPVGVTAALHVDFCP